MSNYNLRLKKQQYPLYILFHPIDGFHEMRYHKEKSVPLAFLILFMWFCTKIFSWQCTGFIFNHNRVDQLNVYAVMAQTFLIFILWCVANWALCTLMNGEGRFSDIWVASAYALLPYILVTVFVTIMSNLLVMEEGVFLTYAAVVGQLWSVAVGFFGMMIIHQYTVKKTLMSILLTLLGIVIMVFLGVLLFSLFQQLFVFVITIFNELKFRF